MPDPKSLKRIIKEETRDDHFRGVNERGRQAAKMAVGHAVRRTAELAGQEHTVAGILNYLGVSVSSNEGWKEGSTPINYPITDDQRAHYGEEHSDGLIREVDTAVSMLMPEYADLDSAKDLAAKVMSEVSGNPDINADELRAKLAKGKYPAHSGSVDLPTVAALDGVVTMAQHLTAEHMRQIK